MRRTARTEPGCDNGGNPSLLAPAGVQHNRAGFDSPPAWLTTQGSREMGIDTDYAEASHPPEDLVPEEWREALAVRDGEDHAIDREMRERALSVDDKWERGAFDA